MTMSLSKQPGSEPALLLEATGAEVELSSLIAESWDLSTVFDAIRVAIVSLVNAENASRLENLRVGAEMAKRLAALNDSVMALQLEPPWTTNSIEAPPSPLELANSVAETVAMVEPETKAEIKEAPPPQPEVEPTPSPSQPSDPSPGHRKTIRKTFWDEKLGAPVTVFQDVEASYACKESEAVIDIQQVAAGLHLENDAVRQSSIVGKNLPVVGSKPDEDRGGRPSMKSKTVSQTIRKSVVDPKTGEVKEVEEEVLVTIDVPSNYQDPHEEQEDEEEDDEDEENMTDEQRAASPKNRRASAKRASLKPGQVACSADFAVELDLRLQSCEREVSHLRTKLDNLPSAVVPQESTIAKEEPAVCDQVDVATEVEKAVAKVVRGLKDLTSTQEALCSTVYAELKAWAQERGNALEGCEETDGDNTALEESGAGENDLQAAGDAEVPEPPATKTLLQHQGHFQDKGRALAHAEKNADVLRGELEALSSRMEESIQTALDSLRTELKDEIAAAVEPLLAAQRGGAIEAAEGDIAMLKQQLLEESASREDSDRLIKQTQENADTIVKSLQDEINRMKWKEERRKLVNGQELSLDPNDLAEKFAQKANRLELQSIMHETGDLRQMMDRLANNTRKLEQQWVTPDEPSTEPCLIGAKCLACGRPSEIPKFAGCLDMDLFMTDRQKDVLQHGARAAHHPSAPQAAPALEPTTKPLPKPPPQFLMPEDIERRQALIRAKQQLEKTRSLPALKETSRHFHLSDGKSQHRLPALPNVPSTTACSWQAWKKN